MRNCCKIGLIIALFHLKVLSAAFTDLHVLADTALADARNNLIENHSACTNDEEEQMKKTTSFDLDGQSASSSS
ncbi:hypothetical protein PGT21_012879 [Puccinia graminis f. sp. tritici]|uniref:Secreted protein n=1 Tax=Puccinia graminis f. sp. tritici TaxID=56615 RepID=A0A5B0PAC4_PUCGR|nr:hypothetical protein PGT21_012879 [Puccinia graminis f. sp. tritici]KAA1134021.1 hypothetical protein PGTUg99_016825 [Puccinia graminis f. sp. tritici]